MIAQIENKPMRDARQESFCQWIARVKGISAKQAYINAGYFPKNAAQSASRILKQVNIRARIEQIRANKERKVVVTPQIIANEAEDNYKLALANGDLKAANSALIIKAKAFGCQTDKVQTEQSESQRARSELEKAVDKDYADYCLRKRLEERKKEVKEGVKS